MDTHTVEADSQAFDLAIAWAASLRRDFLMTNGLTVRSRFRAATAAFGICAVEGVGISEGLMGQMACLEIVPDNLDVVEFGCVFWQPLDGEPAVCRASMASR